LQAYRLFSKARATLRALAAPVDFGALGAVFDHQGRVLLVRHSYTPGWRLPGGGVNRDEAAETAVRRELAEEVGLTGGTARLFGLYVRRAGWVTNQIALFRIDGATIAFTPNWEIREILFADPAAPPDGATPATLRRLGELAEGAPASGIW
jgi:ADP-ribose pyrophosphatase YjhB (NUDIX family)